MIVSDHHIQSLIPRVYSFYSPIPTRTPHSLSVWLTSARPRPPLPHQKMRDYIRTRYASNYSLHTRNILTNWKQIRPLPFYLIEAQATSSLPHSSQNPQPWVTQVCGCLPLLSASHTNSSLPSQPQTIWFGWSLRHLSSSAPARRSAIATDSRE